MFCDGVVVGLIEVVVLLLVVDVNVDMLLVVVVLMDVELVVVLPKHITLVKHPAIEDSF